MDRDYIKRMYLEALAAEEQHLITVCSVLCTEGLRIDVLCNLLKPDNPLAFNSLVEKLSVWNWLFSDNQTIFIEQQVADAVLGIAPIDTNTADKLLCSMQEYIDLSPLDDMINRQHYYLAARLYLTYLMKHWDDMDTQDNQFAGHYTNAVIAFTSNIELSFYGNKRQLVYRLEDRIDFKLLNFIIEKDPCNSEGIANRMLGELYTRNFRYDEATASFRRADLILDRNAKLYLAEACMYENLCILGKAFQMAYRAYIRNKEIGEDDANIEICLYIAYLCAVNDSPRNSKLWRNNARTLLRDRTIPDGHIYNIILKEIEALLHVEDKTLAYQILDSAELDVYRLYGGNAPEMARISYIRSLVDSEVGQLRKSNEQYRRYVDTNHVNYGVNYGDTAILYSAIINDNVIRGNNNTASIFAIKMQDLHAEGPGFAPGVRLSQAFANCASNLAEECYGLSEAYLEVAQKIYDNELKPDEKVLSEIKPIFHDGVIPKTVLMTEESRLINIVTINICLEEGRINEAKELIESLLDKETDCLDRLKWSIHMGRTLIKGGKLNDGIELWRDTINSTPNANKFEIAKEIAEWARAYDLIYESMQFYEDALQADTMVYAKTYDIAEALQCYAAVLDICGLKGKSSEPWKQALLLMRSLGDNDGIALLYFSWGAQKQDYEAESLFEKAIHYWEPERYVYDETASKIFYYLCCAQAMQGKSEEARNSAKKCIQLYPTEFPFLEDIEAYL